MYHYQLNNGYQIQQAQYVQPGQQKQTIIATNPNTINNFNELSRQGNQRVRIKKVYHVIKNREVPSHQEFERRHPGHPNGEYCPECAAAGLPNPSYIPVREPIQYVPPPPPPPQLPVNRQPFQYAPPPPVQNIPFSARIPLPEAPPLPIYSPSAEFSLPINRQAASYTPNNASNNSYNDNSFNNNLENVILLL